MHTEISEQESESASGSTFTKGQKFRRHVNIIGSARYRWSSKWEFISTTMACIISVDAFDAFTSLEKTETKQERGRVSTFPSAFILYNWTCNDLHSFGYLFPIGITDATNHQFQTELQLQVTKYPNFVHHMITFVFIGLPLYYVQILLGQYTQLGTIFFKYLAPIGHGVGLVFITNLLLKTIRHGLMLSNVIVYFFSSIQKEMQWLLCPPNSDKRCWSILSNCTKNCISSTILPSTFIYYEEHYWEFPERDPSHVRLALPQVSKAVTCVMAWVTVGCVVMYSIKNYLKVIRVIWHFSLVLLLILVLGCVLPKGSSGLTRLTQFYYPALINFDAWCKSASQTVTLLGLGRAFHIVHGSFFSPNAPSGMLSVFVVFFTFGIVMICSTITETCMVTIQEAAHIQSINMKNLTEGVGATNIFGVIPFAHGHAGFPQLWSVLFYGTCILILLNNLVTHFITMEKSLSDVYPNLLHYKKYVLALLCLSSFILSIMIVSKEAFLVYRLLTIEVTDHAEVFSCMVTSILVFWVYGVQRFCDDIHFMNGIQPAIFWKTCWCILPLATITVNICIVHLCTHGDLTILYIILYAFCIMPVPAVALIEVFRFVKERNLVGLFQPEERFGPQDSHERYLRRLFNPRKEIRSKRRIDFCQHKCLVGSKVTKKVIQEENTFWHNLTSTNEGEFDSDDSR